MKQSYTNVKAKIFYENEKSMVFCIIKDFLNLDFETIKQQIYEAAGKSFNIKNNFVLDAENDEIMLVLRTNLEELVSFEGISDNVTYDYFASKIKQSFEKNLKQPQSSNNISDLAIDSSIVSVVVGNHIPKYDENKSLTFNFQLKISQTGFKDWEPLPLAENFRKIFERYKKEIVNDLQDILNKFYLKEIGEKNFYDGTLEKGGRINKGVTCNNCLKTDFKGRRFICPECVDFNLCERCQLLNDSEHFHEHRQFLMINDPLKTEDHLLYNSIFNPTRIIIPENEEQISLTVTNVSEEGKNLQGCYLAPIRYGADYFGCKIKSIKDDFPFKKSIELKLDLNKKEGTKGYFRMFTKEGITFGDILEVVNE